MPLVKAVQELSSQNEKLKKQNEEQQQINSDLQNRLAKLEAMINVHQTNISSSQSSKYIFYRQASLEQTIIPIHSQKQQLSVYNSATIFTAKIIVIVELVTP
jgi:predicted RNase H-like nuclease (RuvC/YqgF family)